MKVLNQGDYVIVVIRELRVVLPYSECYIKT